VTIPLDAQGLWEQVKANRAKLDGCAGPHQFERMGRMWYR